MNWRVTTEKNVMLWIYKRWDFDVIRKPLWTPYDEPYEVIQHGKKHFDVKVKGKTINVSMDRLKSAHIMSEDKNITEKIGERERTK